MAERKVEFKAGKGGQTVTPKKGEVLVINYTGDEPTEQYTDKDFSFGQVGKDVVIQRNGTKDYMVIKNMTLNNAKNVTFKAVYKNETKEITWTCDFTNDWYPVTLHINSKGNQGFKFVGTNLNEKVTATSKNDTLKLNGGKQNIVFAGEGNDKIYGSKGNDYFFYGVNDALAFGEDGLTEDIVNEYDSSKKWKLIIPANQLGKVVKDEMVEYYYYKFGTKQNTIEIPYYASQVDTKYYIGYHGDGSDKIYNATKDDNIVLRANSNVSDLTYSRDANNLIIHVDDGKDTPTKITLMDYFNKTDNRLETIYFGDLLVPKTKTEGVTPEDKDEGPVQGTYFTISTDNVDNINFYGSKKLVGSEYNETFIGSKKADKIYTKAGNDTVIAGAGNDKIHLDGKGEKTIVYGWDNAAPYINEGNDTIYVSDLIDKVYISFDGYLVASDTYKASLNGKDLILSMTDKNDEQRGTVTIKDYFVNSNSNISDKFSIDGTNLDLNEKNIYITGNSKKKNTIYDTTYADVIKGGKKVDKIYLSSGNDIINAGKGNDKIYINDDGTKTIIMDKSSGSDSISINNSDAVANIQFGNNDISPNIIYTSNGSNLTITGHYDAIKNARGKITTKAVNDKVTINNYFSNDYSNDFYVNGNELNLSDEKINITGSYNKKKKTYTYTGTEYDDVINGSTKKDIIHAGNGNNIINVGKKGNSIITAGSGNDTYNIQNLNANIDIEDEGGNNDTINLKNTKLSDINLFFNVNKDGDDLIYNSHKENSIDLTIYNNKNAGLVTASKNPTGLIDIDNYFNKEDSSVGGTGYIENFMVGDVNISTELKSVISSIASEVKDFLNGITDKNYTCALDVMADKSKAGKAYLKQMMKIYTSHKLTGQTESLLGAKPMNALLSEVAAWQGNDSSVDTTLKFENSETQDIQTLVAQYSN